jgi:hypothetical protein
MVIRCAYADLVGAKQARDQMDIEVHDWRDHERTIEEMEEAFPFLKRDNLKEKP